MKLEGLGCLTVENARVLVETLEGTRVVREEVAIRMVGKVLGELHKAFCVIKDTAWEGQAASRERSEAGIVESILIAVQEPRLDLVDVVRGEAKLLSHTNRHPSALDVGRLEVVWKRVSSIVEGT